MNRQIEREGDSIHYYIQYLQDKTQGPGMDNLYIARIATSWGEYAFAALCIEKDNKEMAARQREQWILTEKRWFETEFLPYCQSITSNEIKIVFLTITEKIFREEISAQVLAGNILALADGRVVSMLFDTSDGKIQLGKIQENGADEVRPAENDRAWSQKKDKGPVFWEEDIGKGEKTYLKNKENNTGVWIRGY